MFAHLRTLEAIFVREKITYEYLASKVDRSRLVLMADPALLMPAVMPSEERLGFALPVAPVGLNFSPLLSQYATKNDMEAWVTRCAEITVRVSQETDREILLVPHVIFDDGYWDDLRLLQVVHAKVRGRTARSVWCLPGQLTAAETKGVISHCCVFAGARFHSTLAAAACGVPALIFGYSVKGLGLAFDLYGSQEFYIEAAELQPGTVAERICRLLDQREGTAAALTERSNAMKQRVVLAAKRLREFMRGCFADPPPYPRGRQPREVRRRCGF